MTDRPRRILGRARARAAVLAWAVAAVACSCGPAAAAGEPAARVRMPDPELPVAQQVAILRADADAAYDAGDDRLAISTAEAGLRTAAGATTAGGLADDTSALRRVLVRGLVRGGDPGRALEALGKLRPTDGIDETERHALTAVAHDRAGDRGAAVVAHARWRAAVDDASTEAAYCEHRLAVLTRNMSPKRLRDLADGAGDAHAAACLRARAGDAVARDVPAWVGSCRRAPQVVAVLLPRSGKLAALADTQLAAATVAVEVLSRRASTPVRVVWRDTGSTPAGARRAARAAIEAGAEVLVGPMGSPSVKAAREEVGPAVAMVTVGEGPDGVAPSLEQRVDALVRWALRSRRKGFVTAVPDNAYGRRVADAVKAAHERLGFKTGKTLIYPASTTSFSMLRKELGSLQGGVPLLIGDHVGRTELIVRQLRRWGGSAVRVLGTVEGLTPEALTRGRGVLDGVLVAPAAAPGEGDRGFVVAFTAAEGHPPGDQALLVWRALARAFAAPGVEVDVDARVLRVEGGRLVAPRPEG